MNSVCDKPWIHIKTVGPGDQPGEAWLSFPRSVFAHRAGDLTRYVDFRIGVSYQYSEHESKLFLLSVGEREVASFQSFASTFQAIVRGDASLGERFDGIEVVKQRQRTVDDQGQSWIEYELELQRGDLTDTAMVVIRADPETMLPSSSTMTAANEKLALIIDYPEDGPADIHALGVPGDAPVEDRLPSADLKRVLSAVDQGRRDLDNYFAVVVKSHGGTDSLNGLPSLVWRKGKKWRVDVCQLTERTDYVNFVEPGTDMLQWWRERLNVLCAMPYLVCDGRQIDRCGIEIEDGKPVSSGWKRVEKVWGNEHTGNSSFCDSRSRLVELRAYPSNLSVRLPASPHYTMHLAPRGENGPAGSVCVEMLHSDRPPHPSQLQQYWLDPLRGYVLVREETSELDSTAPAKFWPYELDEFRRSPRGVWYPTIIRWKTERSVQTSYYYLDFDAELPDELFQRQAS